MFDFLLLIIYIVPIIVRTILEMDLIMQFINIRELSRFPSKYVKLANEDNDIVITKNGHPYAVLSKIEENEIEDFILAKHFKIEDEFEEAKNEHRSGKTINVRELMNDIE